MCGIAGICGTSLDSERTERQVQQMTNALRHRGPDDEGIFASTSGPGPAACLGHRRLSIIDLARGRQPMCNESGEVWITCNGEIYNHSRLRAELIALGHNFATECDTEVVLHAYEQFGEACLQKLDGMFAFGIWDDRRKCLFAARDPMGIKPFYYARQAGRFLFASEIKGILASGLISAQVNRNALPEFLVFGQTGNDATLFSSIQKLMPGHWLRWDGSSLQIRQYWDWHFGTADPRSSETEMEQRFLELFERSVDRRLMSDVPLGVFLSGGLDSGLIAAVARAKSPVPLKSFSVGYDNQQFSELSMARRVADKVQTQHHEVILQPAEFFSLLPKLIWHEDEPLKGPASVALYAVARFASEHVKVVLTGEGSDEIFAGYEDRYWLGQLNMRLQRGCDILVPARLRKLVRQRMWQLPIPSRLKKLISHTFVYLPTGPEGLLFDNFYSVFTREMQHELLTASLHAELKDQDPYSNAVALLNNCNAEDSLRRLLYTDAKMYLVELLMKQDQISMAASIESRVPFLDRTIIEFAGTLPKQLCMRARQGKRIVKKTAAGLLPKEIVHQPKRGFPVPFKSWLHGEGKPFVCETLLDPETKRRGYFNMDYVERLLQMEVKGSRDCWRQIWMLLNFELWHRAVVDDNHRSDSHKSWTKLPSTQ